MRLLSIQVATVLTVYGIETVRFLTVLFFNSLVATVLTVYGIETSPHIDTNVTLPHVCCNSTYRLRY